MAQFLHLLSNELESTTLFLNMFKIFFYLIIPAYEKLISAYEKVVHGPVGFYGFQNLKCTKSHPFEGTEGHAVRFPGHCDERLCFNAGWANDTYIK